MKKKVNYRSISTGLFALFAFLFFLNSCTSHLKDRTPAEYWMQYASPAEAGWDEDMLNEAFVYADSIKSAAFMLVEDGVVVTTYGDVSRRYMCHSVRKSLLSALFGVYEAKGMIDINKSIAELGIDDKDGLTEQEKQARISDLLKARSGVYHPAAYETAQMAASRPERDSYEPNTNWYYNNWDFNTLGHIFNQETGEDIFEAFKEQIADPLQMEDYQIYHGYYHLEPMHSNFPAYPFRMSARDLARLGLLFDRDGVWNEEQLIPKEWIDESVASYSEIDHSVSSGYGYMWWVLDSTFDAYGGGYTALGVGGQTITVLPDTNIVFVHRTDTYGPTRIPSTHVMNLLSRLLEAKLEDPNDEPKLVALKEEVLEDEYRLSNELIEKYADTYVYRSGYTVEIENLDGQLRLSEPQFGNFKLIPKTDTGFMMEDALKEVFFLETGDSLLFISEHVINAEGYHLLRSNRTDEAIEVLKLNTKYYPASFNAFDSMGEAYLIAGDTASSAEYYKKSLALNPYNIRAMWLLLLAGEEEYREIPLEQEALERFSGSYLFQNQQIILQAESDSLYLMSPEGARVMRLIPVAENEFMLSAGQHFKLVFNVSESTSNEFDLITANGSAGKGIRTEQADRIN